MRRRSTIILTSIVLVALVVSIPVLASIRAGAFGARPHGAAVAMLAGLRDEIDLTDDQVIELRHIARAARERNEQTRGIMKQNVVEAALALLEDPSAVEQATSILERNEAYKDELRRDILGTVAECLEVLTPEQREKIGDRVEMIASRR